MDPIEKAIRTAFEKGDASDRAFREKVYRSAFAALDKSLKSNPSITVERAIARRKALQAKITTIETGFVTPQPVPEPRLDMAPGRNGGGRAEPQFDGADASGFEDPDAVALDPDMRREKPRRRRRPIVVALIAVTFLALAAIGLWWAYGTGLFLSAAERDTAVRTETDLGNEDFSPDAGTTQTGAPPALNSEAPDTRDWISVFAPTDPSTVRTAGGASAEALSDETGAYLRVRSNGAEGAVLFDIGQGVLDRLRGRTATFNIIARGADGVATEIAVDCDLASLGDCGRRRFQAGGDSSDFLFELALPDAAPGAGGTITVRSDVSGGQGAVDVYEVRVAVAE